MTAEYWSIACLVGIILIVALVPLLVWLEDREQKRPYRRAMRRPYRRF